MATGRFGAFDLTPGTAQSLAQGATDGMTVCNINLVNRGNFDAQVSIAISTSANSISALDYIEKDITLQAGGVLERTAVAIKQGEYITVQTSYDHISAVAWGVSDGDAVVVTAIPDVTTAPVPAAFIGSTGFTLLNRVNTHANGTSFVIVGNQESPTNTGALGWAQGRLLAYDQSGEFSYGTSVAHPNWLASESTSRFEASDVDSLGNVYVTGRHMNGVNVGDIGQRLMKLSGAGARVWSKQIQDGTYSGNGWYGDGSAVAVSNDDNVVYVAGETRAGPSNTTTNQQVTILGVNTSDGGLNGTVGNAVIASAATVEARSAKITMSPNGKLIVSWYESAQSRVLIASLNATTFAADWCRKIAFTDNNSNTSFSLYEMSCDSSGNIYFIGAQGLGGTVIGKYSSSGTLQWTRSQNGLNPFYGGNHSIEAIPAGGCIVNLKVQVSGPYEGYQVEFDANGSVMHQILFADDFELQHPTIIGDSIYSTDDNTRIHKYPLARLTVPQTTTTVGAQNSSSSNHTIAAGTFTWSLPGTNADPNVQNVRSVTEAASSISVDTTYSTPATYATPSATYDIVTTIGSASNVIGTITP